MTQPSGFRAKTVQGLIDQLFGITTETRDNPLVTQAEITVTQILRANPSRIGFNLTNLGANPVFFWSDAEVSSTRGIRLNSSGGHAAAKYSDDFARVGYAWFVIATGGVSAIAVQEILIGG